MAVNELSFTQLATVLATITQQATGQAVAAPVDTASFVSVANTALLTGYDNIMNAVSQVLSRTIFSVRPYQRTFKGLEVSPARYGNHIRKLQALDMPFEEDDRMKLQNGQSVDPYVVLKPGVLQTNYYGEVLIQKHLTIFRDQIETAFKSPDELGRFISMILQNSSDQIEQAKENIERSTVANLICGATKCNTPSVMHLVTLYNAFAGTSLTTATVVQPANWKPFVQWLIGFLSNIIDKLAERSMLYHLNITDKAVARHTPKDRLKVYLNSEYVNHMETSAYSNTFHDDYLKKVTFSKVTFWQDIADPFKIMTDCGYITAAGAVDHDEVTLNNVFGVMFDDEAAMTCPVNEWSANSAFNPRGAYTNMFWHMTYRYLNDFTENCIVLLLD